MYTKKIYFSGGDFRELQEVFRELPGVLSTHTGYINGDDEADLDSVASGKVRAYMGIEVVFNPKKTDLSQLMDVLFAVVNPYVPDGQGKARGEQYRAGVFYLAGEDEPQVQLHLNFIANRGRPPAVTGQGLTLNDPNSNPKLARHCYVMALPLRSFQRAEVEYQEYFVNHPEAESFIDFKKLREYVKF